jgi:hypothetical protein
MQPNPVLRKLGLRDDDRVAIIHADDVGMCHASVSAYGDLMDFGLVSSAATMVPCGWFSALAAYCRQHPGMDVGVHLTLTCEWDTYRWGPISTRDSASGLIDDEGFFYRSSNEAVTHGNPAAVAIEVKAQIERALAAGVDATHIDTHMGTMTFPPLIPLYIQAALEYRLPVMFFRWGEEKLRARGYDAERIAQALKLIEMLEAQNMPLIDHIVGMPLEGEKPLELAQQAFAALEPGITHFIIHPSHDTPELRAIAPDWRARVADFEWFASEKLRDFIRDAGIHVIGYRALRDLLRSENH